MGAIEGVRVVGFRREGTIEGVRVVGEIVGFRREALEDWVVVGTIEGVLEVIKVGMIDGMKVGKAEGLLERVVVFTLVGLLVVGRLVGS